MPQGTLFVTVRAADSAFPVRRAHIQLFAEGGEPLGEDTVTEENGSVSRDFSLEAPDPAATLLPEGPLPYSTYEALISAEGFYPFRIRGIQIFASVRSELPVEMIPLGQSEAAEPLEINIGPHGLRSSEERSPAIPEEEERVLRAVIIPEKVTVHLGAPDASARNVSVPFTDYIKNVASSEIYPTWPENSLRANILCQISLVLNRVFTEWYPSRGYPFTITNSTAYDQYFVYGRNIYDPISRIVDEIFNQYLRRTGRIDPYFAEYCNGSTVTCAGLSQWGTVPLAQSGRTPLEILRFYYGNVEIAQTNRIGQVEASYPGAPLSRGSSGRNVTTIQQQLNRIRINYPAIPAVTSVDGIFGSETEAAVKAFQKIFNLTADGIVGKATWYRISYIYVAVKKLAELNSEGEREQYDDNSFPGTLRSGDTGTAVQTLQLYLKTLAAYNPFLPDLSLDGVFGPDTEQAVRQFQELYGLYEDGVVGENTWNRLVEAYLSLGGLSGGGLRPWPGTLLSTGSQGEDVRYVQDRLNTLRSVFVTVPSLSEDGDFGPRTRLAVREFQRIFGLGIDGVVGRNTWNALNRVSAATVSGCLRQGGSEINRILSYGSAGEDVRRVQTRLNVVGRALAPIPALIADGQYGTNTEAAVRIFQGLVGLKTDGIVGNLTATRLSQMARGVEAGCLPLQTRAVSQGLPLPPLPPRMEEPSPASLSLPSFFSSPQTEENDPSPWPRDCPWRNAEEWETR